MTEITESVQIVLPQHCNGYKKPRLFGGQLMAWIDVVGAVAAKRYAKSNVTTVCVDNLNFLNPAYLNETVLMQACVTWTGRTSLEVRVDTFVERIDGTREKINRAYLVFVALNENNEPVPVPELHPETQEEADEFEAAIARRYVRLNR